MAAHVQCGISLPVWRRDSLPQRDAWSPAGLFHCSPGVRGEKLRVPQGQQEESAREEMPGLLSYRIPGLMHVCRAAGCTFTAGKAAGCSGLSLWAGQQTQAFLRLPRYLHSRVSQEGVTGRPCVKGSSEQLPGPQGEGCWPPEDLTSGQGLCLLLPPPSLKYLVSRGPPHQVLGGLTCLHPALNHSCTYLLTQPPYMCGATPHECAMGLSEELVFVSCKQS